MSFSAILIAGDFVCYLQRLGYPYLSPTLRTGGKWPLIELWDDSTEQLRFIGVCVNGASLPEALTYARQVAAVCPHPATAHAISEYHFVHDDNPLGEG